MPHTLLLADDSVTIQRVIELTFADEDVHVIAVGNGRQAVDRIALEPPDIVLADVGMPGCKGYEVAAFVKERPDLAHIPVLLLTGAFEPVDENRVRQVRADGVLAKPFKPHELITRVKALLGVRAAQLAESEAEETFGSGEPAPELAAEADGDGANTRTGVGGVSRPVSPAGSGVSLDDYFDRLDAAFASLSVPSHIEEAAASSRPAPDAAWRPLESGADAGPDQPGPDKPVGADADRVQPPAAPVRGVTAADAFAAFLEAEQSGQHAPGADARLGSVVLGPPYPSVEELVDMVSRRVIAQLSDQAVRQTVADTVSDVAERLVREEIARLSALTE